MAAVGTSLCLASRWIDFIVGIAVFILALWFWLAGRWIDRNSNWRIPVGGGAWCAISLKGGEERERFGERVDHVVASAATWMLMH
jgi:hypothetical protein